MSQRTFYLLAILLLIVAGCAEAPPEPSPEAAGQSAVDQATESSSADQSAHIEQLYTRSCFACHSSGTAGAPRTGDVARWSALIEAKGKAGLVASAIEGLGGMPPRGLCAQCTERDFELLIDFMAKSQ